MLRNAKAQKQQPQWIVPTLANGWVDYSSSAAPASYLLDELGFVHFRGNIKNGVTAAQTTLFTLPRGYRPQYNQYFTAVTNDGTNYRATTLTVDSNGLVSITPLNTAGSSLLSLDQIIFKALQ
jgi:hypothetical protein